MTIKEIRSLAGLSQAKFSEQYGIPKRTVENWESGVNAPPAYVVELLEYKIKNELKEANIMTKKNLETVELYGMDCTVRFDPKKVCPAIIEETDVYDKAVITEGERPLLIAWNDGISEWVCLGSPDDLGWERIDPDSAESIARTIRDADKWQLDLGDDSPEYKLCKLAGLEDELEAADGDTFEIVIYKAAEILGVEI